MEIPVKKQFESAEMSYQYDMIEISKARTNKDLLNIINPTNTPMFRIEEFNQFPFEHNKKATILNLKYKYINIIDQYSFN